MAAEWAATATMEPSNAEEIEQRPRSAQTPLESEQPLDAESAEKNDSSDEDDDVHIKIGDINPNLSMTYGSKPRSANQSALSAAGSAVGKLDMDQTPSVAGKIIWDLELATMQEKPWRKPGADITDYFNYGFNEETWNTYCERQKKLRAEYGSQQAANRVLFSQLTGNSSQQIPITGAGGKTGQTIQTLGATNSPKIVVDLTQRFKVQSSAAATSQQPDLTRPPPSQSGTTAIAVSEGSGVSSIPVLGGGSGAISISTLGLPIPTPSLADLVAPNVTAVGSPSTSLTSAPAPVVSSAPLAAAPPSSLPPATVQPVFQAVAGAAVGAAGLSDRPPGVDTPPAVDSTSTSAGEIAVAPSGQQQQQQQPPPGTTIDTSQPPPNMGNLSLPPPGYAMLMNRPPPRAQSLQHGVGSLMPPTNLPPFGRLDLPPPGYGGPPGVGPPGVPMHHMAGMPPPSNMRVQQPPRFAPRVGYIGFRPDRPPPFRPHAADDDRAASYSDTSDIEEDRSGGGARRSGPTRTSGGGGVRRRRTSRSPSPSRRRRSDKPSGGSDRRRGRSRSRSTSREKQRRKVKREPEEDSRRSSKRKRGDDEPSESNGKKTKEKSSSSSSRKKIKEEKGD